MKPILDFENNSSIKAKDSRHPLVELNVDSDSYYVPNNINTGEHNKIKVVTGPNASGKSVYLKQIGLLVYMTMIGSYVPASEAIIGDIDRIYTRIGSNDSLSLQHSTFLADVLQIAEAINGSSPKSLIIVDEFGKGTNSCDQQALVSATVRHFISMSSDLAPKVYFSTHFYEIFTQYSELFRENVNKIEFLTFDYLVDDKEPTENCDKNYKFNRLIYLYKLKNGITDSSYALNVLKRAGIPDQIIERAQKIYEIIKNNTRACEDDEESDDESNLDLLQSEETSKILEKYHNKN